MPSCSLWRRCNGHSQCRMFLHTSLDVNHCHMTLTWKQPIFSPNGNNVVAVQLFQFPIKCLIVRSREVSKPRDLYSKLFDRSEIWQARRQHRCRSACQISKRRDDLNCQSHGFETLWDLTIRHLIGYWNCTHYIWVYSTLCSISDHVYQYMFGILLSDLNNLTIRKIQRFTHWRCGMDK